MFARIYVRQSVRNIPSDWLAGGQVVPPENEAEEPSRLPASYVWAGLQVEQAVLALVGGHLQVHTRTQTLAGTGGCVPAGTHTCTPTLESTGGYLQVHTHVLRPLTVTTADYYTSRGIQLYVGVGTWSMQVHWSTHTHTQLQRDRHFWYYVCVVCIVWVGLNGPFGRGWQRDPTTSQLKSS